jgi:hypothetical protein
MLKKRAGGSIGCGAVAMAGEMTAGSGGLAAAILALASSARTTHRGRRDKPATMRAAWFARMKADISDVPGIRNVGRP